MVNGVSVVSLSSGFEYFARYGPALFGRSASAEESPGAKAT